LRDLRCVWSRTGYSTAHPRKRNHRAQSALDTFSQWVVQHKNDASVLPGHAAFHPQRPRTKERADESSGAENKGRVGYRLPRSGPTQKPRRKNGVVFARFAPSGLEKEKSSELRLLRTMYVSTCRSTCGEA